MLDKFELIAIISTISFTISLLIVVLLIPPINKLGFKYNIIDIPNQRKKHNSIIVRLGGLGIFWGFILGLLITYKIIDLLGIITIDYGPIYLIITGSICFFLIGLTDDIFSLSPFLRLISQVLISSFLYVNGIKFEAIDLSWISPNLHYLFIPQFLSFAMVTIWIVGLTNAINWLDGLDGLASGVCLISCVGLFVIFLSLGRIDLVFVCSTFCGAIIGFLRYNFFPAKILMGDGGSYLLGSTLSILAIVGLSYNFNFENLIVDESLNVVKVFPINIAILVFFIPIIDMVLVILTRIYHGNSPFYPDRSHIHHKILNMGLNDRGTVIIIYALSQLFVCMAVYLSGVPFKIFYICVSIILMSLSFLYCLNMQVHLNSQNRKEL